MASPVLLDSISHRDMTVMKGYRLQAQDGLGAMQIFPAELDAAHKEFPIFIRKHTETGQLFLSALLGRTATENAYFANGQWTSRYVPMMARRGPFLMGRGNEQDSLQMYVDLDDARVVPNGDRLFDDQGAPTVTTVHAAGLLNAIHQGHLQTQTLIEALINANLVESLVINAGGGSDEEPTFKGLYSVNADKLKRLDPQFLGQLNGEGHLQLAYFIASATSNLIPLIESGNVKA